MSVEKTFRGEATKMRDLLKSRTPFALARFGHAEMEILQGRLMHGRERSGGHEYRYAPADADNALPRQRLWEAFRYSAANYFVGINCPHCALQPGNAQQDFEWMRDHSGQPEDRLTFATIYFYSNYPYYQKQVMPLFREYDTALVCHENGRPEELPFQPVKVFRNTYDAWRRNWPLVDEIKTYISDARLRGALFLFCAGAFSCMLAHELYAWNPRNTYMDIGSSLDPFLFAGTPYAHNRRYLKQDPETQARESCYWMPRPAGAFERVAL